MFSRGGEKGHAMIRLGAVSGNVLKSTMISLKRNTAGNSDYSVSWVFSIQCSNRLIHWHKPNGSQWVTRQTNETWRACGVGHHGFLRLMAPTCAFAVPQLLHSVIIYTLVSRVACRCLNYSRWINHRGSEKIKSLETKCLETRTENNSLKISSLVYRPCIYFIQNSL